MGVALRTLKMNDRKDHQELRKALCSLPSSLLLHPVVVTEASSKPIPHGGHWPDRDCSGRLSVTEELVSLVREA